MPLIPGAFSVGSASKTRRKYPWATEVKVTLARGKKTVFAFRSRYCFAAPTAAEMDAWQVRWRQDRAIEGPGHIDNHDLNPL